RQLLIGDPGVRLQLGEHPAIEPVECFGHAAVLREKGYCSDDHKMGNKSKLIAEAGAYAVLQFAVFGETCMAAPVTSIQGARGAAHTRWQPDWKRVAYLVHASRALDDIEESKLLPE